MKCNCSIGDIVLSVIILIFALWPEFIYSQWIIVISAVLIIIHAIWHKHNHMGKIKVTKSSKRR
jgi:hypothetical protein